MWQLLNTTWSGVWIGCGYAVIGLGLVLTYRVSRVVNLAVGGVFVFAGMELVWLQAKGIPPVLALAAVTVSAMVLSAAQEVVVLQRVVKTTAGNQLLSTLGFAIALSGLTAVWFGRDPVTGRGLLPIGRLELGQLRLAWNSLAFVVGIVMVTALAWWLTTRWRTGRAASAGGYDPMGAQMIGLNVRGLRLAFMALVGMVTGFGAGMFVPLGVLDFSMGLRLTLFGFVAASVSGYRSIAGVLAGGIAFGVVDALGTAYVSSVFGTAITFTVLIAIALASQRLRERQEKLVTV